MSDALLRDLERELSAAVAHFWRVREAQAGRQAGGGAVILIASGVTASAAVDFALATQALAVMAGAAVVLATLVWHGSRRLVFRTA